MVNIKKFLKENADIRYADFNKKFITSKYPILGVRTPILRKFAKEIEPEYIEFDNTLSHEEILLYGLSASYLKSETEQLEYLENIMPYIDNWGTCDCIVCSMKKLNGQKSYQFFTNLLYDNHEFYIRIGIVGLMRFFINSDKIHEIIANLSKITNTAYYVQMATAWFFAELCATDFNLAFNCISKINDKFIRNKSISKARESFRVSKENKNRLLNLKI